MKIWTPLLRETKEKLERGIRVKNANIPADKESNSNRRLVSVLWGVYASGQGN